MPARPLCYGQCAGNRRLAARYDLPLSARPRGRRVVAGSVPTDDGWRMLDQYPSQYVSRERSVCCVCCLRTEWYCVPDVQCGVRGCVAIGSGCVAIGSGSGSGS